MPEIKQNIIALFITSCVMWVGYGASATAAQPSLLEINQIADNGAPGLALNILERLQSELVKDQSRWLEWEKARIQLYAKSHDWQKLLDRVTALPTGLPAGFLRWAQTEQVGAMLELDQGATARKLLHQLIIATAGQTDEETLNWLKRWRQQIIMAYISEQQVDDAHMAILRFQQDYAADDLETLLLRAKVLLMNQQSEEVVELLTSHTKQPEAGMLYLLAQLRARQRPPLKVVQAGLRQMRGKWADQALKDTLWAVVAESAQQAGDRETTVIALEHLLASKQLHNIEKLFVFNVDSLWNAYIDFALYSGNKAQFLIGQDEKWFGAANKHFKKKAVMARAYYALLMHRGQTAENKLKAADKLVQSLKGRKSGGRLMLKLFINSQHFASVSDIPEPARRTLVDVTLAQNDIPLASEIMATIKTAPKDDSGYMWYLRRARILVLGGQAENGAKALNEFLDLQAASLNKEKIERLLQVVFDLQTVTAHDEAYELFARIIDLKLDTKLKGETFPDEKLQRELYYWMADSRRAQQRYTEAAHLYLKSAMLPDGKGLDPWGQTARYQAAECLGQAGLVEDAHMLFSHLLRVTKEQDRRAVLQHELHKLRLTKAKQNKRSEIVEQEVSDELNQ